MATTTVRISTQTHDRLRLLAQTNGVSMQQIIDQALEIYSRQQLLQTMNEAYARLRTDEGAWKAWKTFWSRAGKARRWRI